jgi:hypothetical protein
MRRESGSLRLSMMMLAGITARTNDAATAALRPNAGLIRKYRIGMASVPAMACGSPTAHSLGPNRATGIGLHPERDGRLVHHDQPSRVKGAKEEIMWVLEHGYYSGSIILVVKIPQAAES